MSNASDFEIENGVLKKYVGPGGDVIVPEGVTAIRGSAFRGCTGIKTIAIPDGVLSIDLSVFCKCNQLREVILPAKLESIDVSDAPENLERFSCRSKMNHFTIIDGLLLDKSGTQLIYYPRGRKDEEYHIPFGVKKIMAMSFVGSQYLKRINLPESVVTIQECGFAYCGAELIRLPKSIKKMSKKILRCPTEYGIYMACHVICYSPEIAEKLKQPIYIGSIDDLVPKAKSSAVDGFLYAEENGIDEIQPYRDSYIAHIKNNVNTYLKKMDTDENLLSLLIRENLVPAKRVDEVVKLTAAKKRPDLTAMLLEAQTGVKAHDVLKLPDNDPEIQRKLKMEERRESIKNQEGIAGVVFVASGDLPEIGVWHDEYTGAIDWTPLKKHIEAHGGFLRSTVSSKTDYLICNDPNSTSKKCSMARELGIPIISEKEFIRMASEE